MMQRNYRRASNGPAVSDPVGVARHRHGATKHRPVRAVPAGVLTLAALQLWTASACASSYDKFVDFATDEGRPARAHDELPSNPKAYERCAPRPPGAEAGCQPELFCHSPLLGRRSMDLPGMCTQSCTSTRDCAPGADVSCERFVDGQFCVVRCSRRDGRCPSGTTCIERSRIDGEAVHLCAPR